MAKRKRPVTWIEVAIHFAGLRNAVKAISWAYCWAVTREALGHEPTPDEVAEWWLMSRRTAFRDQKAFREAFPMLETPAPIYDSDEAREVISKHAAAYTRVDDRIDRWGEERRARKDLDAMRAALGTASTDIAPPS